MLPQQGTVAPWDLAPTVVDRYCPGIISSRNVNMARTSIGNSTAPPKLFTILQYVTLGVHGESLSSSMSDRGEISSR